MQRFQRKVLLKKEVLERWQSGRLRRSLRDLDTKGNTLAAAFTLSHGNCTSYSEVWNQNNQLDYFTRDAEKKQAFF